MHRGDHRGQSRSSRRAARGPRITPTNCGSMESNPVAIDGVLYTTNAPLGQTFAIDAATGHIIWEYTPSYAGETLPNGTAVHAGQRRPASGVAVARGQGLPRPPDGRLVALNQMHGSQVWENTVGSYKTGAADLQRPDLRRRLGHRRGLAPATAVAAARSLRPSGPTTAPASGAWTRFRRRAARDTSTWLNNGKEGTAARTSAAARSGSRRSSTRSSASSSSALATRSRGTRAARARTSTPTRSSP